MAAKKNMDINPAGNEKQAKGHSTSAVVLQIGDWRNRFEEYECKLFIAKSLNYCVHYHELIITGYLITRHNLYLVMKIEPNMVNRMMMIFFEKIRREIERHFDKIKKSNAWIPEKTEANSDMEEMYARLFKKYPLTDQYLIKLMTGKKIDLPYHDPQLERLKQELRSSDFCSVINYTGARGPVIIKKSK